jgi:Flp pilus assembly pilin Flp
MSLQCGWTIIAGVIRLGRDKRAQDLIEYALLAGFVAVAVAAVFPSSIAPSISAIFSRVVGFLEQVP